MERQPERIPLPRCWSIGAARAGRQNRANDSALRQSAATKESSRRGQNLLKRNSDKGSGATVSMNRGEVAIVGGSAAGLFTAALLARGGRRVRVLEASERLDPATRTLIVTRRMHALLGAAGAAAVANAIRRLEIC